MDIPSLIKQLQQGDIKALAKSISIVENELEGHEQILQSLTFQKNAHIIGITGPPGAGKSTLVNCLLKNLSQQNKKIGVIAIDPSSPFHHGALLGDRIRMREHFTHPNIFIRSLASRGSLGGLSEKVIEVMEVMRAFGFDYIFIETVGVGQSEVEIAALADTTVVVLVPESGDEVQTMKAGLVEIADIFVVNKADRADADIFANNLKMLIYQKEKPGWEIPVVKTVATNNSGTDELIEKINQNSQSEKINEKKMVLLAQKAIRLIQSQRMKDVDLNLLKENIEKESKSGKFNLYNFVKKYF